MLPALIRIADRVEAGLVASISRLRGRGTDSQAVANAAGLGADVARRRFEPDGADQSWPVAERGRPLLSVRGQPSLGTDDAPRPEGRGVGMVIAADIENTERFAGSPIFKGAGSFRARALPLRCRVL